MFAAMLKGEIAMPVPPSYAVKEVTMERNQRKTWGDGANSAKMAEYINSQRLISERNLYRVIGALESGVTDRSKIIEITGLSLSTVQKKMQELVDGGYVEKVHAGQNAVKWVRTAKALPHSYSTENSREVTSGKDCKCPVANCAICGEGR